jgi:tRNA threonylcarbamoyladenosine modification (KEOPS) complex Cgi121 subunit
MHYHGMRESHILKILKDGKEFTVFVKDEESNDIRIVGENQLLRDFVRDIAAEQAAIFCSELCDCIADETSKQVLRDTFRHKLKATIDEIVTEACEAAGACSDDE